MSEKANSKLTITDLPEGTVTFLFTDIEGSTKLLKQLGADRYGQVLADQRRILRSAFEQYHGAEIDTQGDAFFASFPRATQAVAAVVEIQRNLVDHDWPEGVAVRLRIGLHTGEPLVAEEGYVGMDVHRAARIANVGHGGQVLLSETTAALVRDELPVGVSLLDLGHHRLKDLSQPEHIRQLVIEGLPSEFPLLKSLELLPPAISLDSGEFKLPAFLEEEVKEAPAPVFVGRERELARLEGYLERAVAGQGGLVFITGGPGRGKTTLMKEFARRAMGRHPGLLVVKGNCDAYSGMGDPYLPFRDILTMISGDLESRWSAGLISREQAGRLWRILPQAFGAILDYGPDLINRLLLGKNLLTRALEISGFSPELLGRLQVLVQQSNPPGLDQVALFGQFTSVLGKLSNRNPFVLILDDLQWMDTGSVNLLFHLGRRIAGNRILLVGAYRSEEIALGRDGGQHPLEQLLAEFKRQYGDIWIDLEVRDTGRDKHFVEAYLDSEPNRLSPTFRKALYEHTEGHPLFTIELLRNLQEQGDLALDEEGRWVERGLIDWKAIPSKVEGVIEERIGRLEHGQREILTTASVEGEEFTAQVVARIRNMDESELLHSLSHSLDRQHRLIMDRGVQRLGENLLFLFVFRHNLFQTYLYEQLNESQRVVLHQAVGQALESLYQGYADRISPQLARHFDLAGLVDKAVQYYTLAGKHAMRMSANHEAIAHIHHALDLLINLPASPKRSSQELDLQLMLPPSLTAVKGWAAPELEAVYDRALELCSELTDDSQLIRTLWLLAVYRMGRSEYQKVDTLIEQLSSIAQRTADPRWTWMGKYNVSKLYQGNFKQTRDDLESVSRLYDPNEARNLAQIYGMAPHVVGEAYLSNCLWLLGYPEKALASTQEALKRADEVNVPLTTCYVLSRSCWLYMQLHDFEATRAQAEELLRISQENRIKSFEPGARIYIHAARLQAGETVGDQLERMYQEIEVFKAMGTILNRTAWLVIFAETCARIGQTERGLAAASEAISLGEKTGELWLQAEAYRLKGELSIRHKANDKVSYTEAESCFLSACEIARSQAARSLELRAGVSLLRLAMLEVDPEPARQRLFEIYSDFEEGLDTLDLIEARRLLGL